MSRKVPAWLVWCVVGLGIVAVSALYIAINSGQNALEESIHRGR